ncbi:MAG TPA: VOC family protein [Melioribacteraceae bacterium]|nr:VOC family protein [Melioribacteraceae bacterium]
MKPKIRSVIFLLFFFIVISLLWVVASFLLKEKQLNSRATYMKISKLSPILLTKDVVKSMDFYKDELGFSCVAQIPEKGIPEFVMLLNGEVELMIQKSNIERSDTNNFISLYMDVENVQKLFEKIKNNVKIIKPIEKTFYGTKEFTCYDNIGNILTFAEHID